MNIVVDEIEDPVVALPYHKIHISLVESHKRPHDGALLVRFVVPHSTHTQFYVTDIGQYALEASLEEVVFDRTGTDVSVPRPRWWRDRLVVPWRIPPLPPPPPSPLPPRQQRLRRTRMVLYLLSCHW